MTASPGWRVSGIDRADADPVVLLPGIGGSASFDFAWLAPMLARTRFVIEIDFGAPATAVADVRAALAEAAPGRSVTLLGYSYGAVIALELAAALPGVSRLVLVAGVLASEDRQALFASTWKTLGDRSLPEGWHIDANPAEMGRFDTPEGSARAHLAAFARFAAASFERDPFPLGEVTDAQVAALASVDLEASAARIDAETLVIGFADDAIAGTEQALRLFAAIDDCRYAELDGGHVALLERPAEILSLVDGFLAGSYPVGARVQTVST